MCMGVRRNFSEGVEYFRKGKFQFDGKRTNDGAENKNITAKSLNVLICFAF